MAEFQEVMKQAKRMCKEHDECDGCALREIADNADIYCPIQTMRKMDVAKVEAAVVDWAAKNPEPRYPTWNEWYKATFPNSNFHTIPCPSIFYKICETSNYHGEAECYECKNSPISADIAEKLGIKPIGGNEDA